MINFANLWDRSQSGGPNPPSLSWLAPSSLNTAGVFRRVSSRVGEGEPEDPAERGSCVLDQGGSSGWEEKEEGPAEDSQVQGQGAWGKRAKVSSRHSGKSGFVPLPDGVCAAALGKGG
ncbi:hypothetical protein I315_04654 [Cryptococcus gattii Ru294]|nr:hypothetical protein I315_04654 [Cryptococcus gattii Ru294]